MADVIQVEKREKFGKRNSKRLRLAGHTPVVLYGHGGDNVSLSACSDQIANSLRHGAKIIELEGAATGQALIQDMQWDIYSTHVIHLDLVRVKAGERVHMEVPLELRGNAPGVKAGGIVETLAHSLEIEIEVSAVVERLHISINDLELNGTLTASAIEDLPDGAIILGDADRVLVQCVEPKAAAEEEGEETTGESAEPEVIGGKSDEEENKE